MKKSIALLVLLLLVATLSLLTSVPMALAGGEPGCLTKVVGPYMVGTITLADFSCTLYDCDANGLYPIGDQVKSIGVFRGKCTRRFQDVSFRKNFDGGLETILGPSDIVGAIIEHSPSNCLPTNPSLGLLKVINVTNFQRFDDPMGLVGYSFITGLATIGHLVCQ
jgi:hypothetical protein